MAATKACRLGEAMLTMDDGNLISVSERRAEACAAQKAGCPDMGPGPGPVHFRAEAF